MASRLEKKRAYNRAWMAAHGRAWRREWSRKNPDKVREYGRKRYAQHAEEMRKKVREYARLRRVTRPDEVRAADRKKRGLPEPTRPCPAVCENCGRPPGKKSLCLDHDHETGEFRGWLCGVCNSGIGKLGDSIAGLERAIVYLKECHARRPSCS